MKKLYTLPSLNLPTEYFSTLREARQAQQAQDDEPERISTVDAAKECTILSAWREETESARLKALYHLKELVAVVPRDMLSDTTEGRRAIEYLRAVAPEFLADCRL